MRIRCAITGIAAAVTLVLGAAPVDAETTSTPVVVVVTGSTYNCPTPSVCNTTAAGLGITPDSALVHTYAHAGSGPPVFHCPPWTQRFDGTWSLSSINPLGGDVAGTLAGVRTLVVAPSCLDRYHEYSVTAGTGRYADFTAPPTRAISNSTLGLLSNTELGTVIVIPFTLTR